jgi:hypothetical protein
VTPPQVPPVDPGNQLLSEVPALLTTAIVNTPQGQRLAATIRTASTGEITEEQAAGIRAVLDRAVKGLKP